MKQITIFILITVLSNGYAVAQINRYDSPAKSNYTNTYVSPDWDNIFRMLEHSQSVQDRNAKIIDDMIDALYRLKSQTDNTSFENKLDEFLSSLKNLRLGSLVNAETEIKKIDWAIRDELELYNSGKGKYASSINKSTTNLATKFF